MRCLCALSVVLLAAVVAPAQCPNGVCPTPSQFPLRGTPPYQWSVPGSGSGQGYTPHWTHPPDLHGHLSGHHGVPAAQLAGMSAADMQRLHDQIHDAESGRAAPAFTPGGRPAAGPRPAAPSSGQSAIVSRRGGLFPDFQPFGGAFRPVNRR